MEVACPGFALLLLLGGGLLGVVAIALIVLVKLGVIVNYATREEEPDQGEYNLDDSHEPGE
ncbi:MAG: hypothetical protein JXA93_20470 [Anaerolineae bacterium]|nr:hypothetical protein [Anaerolineae bacterium]